jgi:hypothetical protein
VIAVKSSQVKSVAAASNGLVSLDNTCITIASHSNTYYQV